ncbi:hypothetical protein Nepgr_032004 [Nepenthes gracilis]|uniref:Secreted protein n=1 Tax=Nepenthes gracilis TaxID=150966 RepID=A0AAD3TJ71_NEPGR|nr:hypothetical protein Nepgr_032004 [Nepenthes gracilis]
MYSAVLFLWATNASTVQAVVDIERTTLYCERAAGMYSALPCAFAQLKLWNESMIRSPSISLLSQGGGALAESI